MANTLLYLVVDGDRELDSIGLRITRRFLLSGQDYRRRSLSRLYYFLLVIMIVQLPLKAPSQLVR